MLWKKGDGAVIDGYGPDGIASRVQNVTTWAVRLQTGYLYHYAFAMLIGVALLITWSMFTGAGTGGVHTTPIDWPILSLTAFLPLLGVLFILLVPGEDEGSKKNIRMVTLVTTGVTFVLSLAIWAFFDYTNPGFQFVEQRDWLGGNISYRMGVDGISVLFVILTTFLMPFCVLASWKAFRSASRNT
ncbi:hypothetical protein OKA06_20280 [Novosphingobium sp. MW5]|nr:hypothetical protein [Novosphingobium sp. MW5]